MPGVAPSPPIMIDGGLRDLAAKLAMVGLSLLSYSP
jgi:hypothetical protein